MNYCYQCGEELDYPIDDQNYDSKLGLLCDMCDHRARRFGLGEKYGPPQSGETHLGVRLKNGKIVSSRYK